MNSDLSATAVERGAQGAYEFWRRNQPNGTARFVPWSGADEYTRGQWLGLVSATLRAALDERQADG